MFGGDVIWVTGLPGSGKTTLASQLKTWSLEKLGFCTLWIDGDDYRKLYSGTTGHSTKERETLTRHYLTHAQLAAQQGIRSIVSTFSAQVWVEEAIRSTVSPSFIIMLEVSKDLRMAERGGVYSELDLETFVFPPSPNLVLEAQKSSDRSYWLDYAKSALVQWQDER